jgi:hypothetical protein
MAKSQALEKRLTTEELQAQRPEFLKTTEGMARGQEEVTMRDLILPRLAIAQKMSEEVDKSNPDAFVPGLEEGMLFNSLTKHIYGREVLVTPLFFHKSRIKFRPMDQGGGIECMNPTGRACALNNGGPCLYANWGPKGEKPECDELSNFPSFIIDEKTGGQEFIIISFKRTGTAAARDLNSKIRMRKSDMFAGTYRLTTTIDQNKLGQRYYVPVVNNAGWVSEAVYLEAEKTYNMFRDQIVTGAITMDTGGLAQEGAAEEAPF